MANTPDILIVGGGVAGTTAAILAAEQGLKTVLIDRWVKYPNCFKAEKIESDQADLYRKFRLMDTLRPWTGSIREIWWAQSGRVIRHVPTEQYGIFYHDMVNALRTRLPKDVEFKAGRVTGIQNTEDRQTVTLDTGEVYMPRLVVMAAGTGPNLSAQLGLKRQMIQKEQSFAAGFNIQRVDGRKFDFDSITYYPDGTSSRLAYLTLFWIGSTMRANLFACWSNSEERARQFVADPKAELSRWLPELTNLTGPFEIASPVESGRIDLYQTESPARPGIVLIADAFQSVCPITGTGLTKVLTDVDVLCLECLPEWLASPGMPQSKIASFYAHPRKQEVDRLSIAGAHYARHISTDVSLGWHARRLHRSWENRLSGALAQLTPTKATA